MVDDYEDLLFVANKDYPEVEKYPYWVLWKDRRVIWQYNHEGYFSTSENWDNPKEILCRKELVSW